LAEKLGKIHAVVFFCYVTGARRQILKVRSTIIVLQIFPKMRVRKCEAIAVAHSIFMVIGREYRKRFVMFVGVIRRKVGRTRFFPQVLGHLYCCKVAYVKKNVFFLKKKLNIYYTCFLTRIA